MNTARGLALLALTLSAPIWATDLHLNDQDYFEAQGLSVLVYHNTIYPVFRDQKLGGVEIILHGERIATDGEVRLQPTPEQWDAVPTFISRKHGASADQLIATSGYPDFGLSYRLELTAHSRYFPGRPDGPHQGTGELPRLARCLAHGRCSPGTHELHPL